MNSLDHIFRLLPGQDLKNGIHRYVCEHSIEAASIIMGIGSLTEAQVRLSNDTILKRPCECFEIQTLMGTASKSGGLHLHITLADKNGLVLGGHLLEGCLINTTAEITLIEHKNKRFMREKDESTGYLELKVFDL